jgi:hypothetical protein
MLTHANWDVKRSGTWTPRSPIRESDPTKGSPPVATIERALRDTPSGHQIPARVKYKVLT